MESLGGCVNGAGRCVDLAMWMVILSHEFESLFSIKEGYWAGGQLWAKTNHGLQICHAMLVMTLQGNHPMQAQGVEVCLHLSSF